MWKSMTHPTGRPSSKRQSGVLTRQYRYVIGCEGGSLSRSAAVIPRVEEFSLLCFKNLGHVSRPPSPLPPAHISSGTEI
ncbi:hypothetical protein TNCT_187911 [Trichonephila clavata]|uniref:Uncharacterized protein n=1 Tax=Trichonephila clavata TaxID=2740835 RepID=A0A8X6IHN7_TRICU|nr:hypothetical protein TNCT_187911 [Trichonephila clavata]